MKYKKIVAIIRKGHLEKVEHALQEHGVRGITVTRGKGIRRVRELLLQELDVRTCTNRTVRQ